jgi:trk system potassium uptake protein TrkH
LSSRKWRRRLTPTEVFVGSFALLIVVGSLGLKLLPGIYAGEPLGWTDAVFTATSAVCVTGLIVVDTGSYFTLPGQVFLLALIQLGGLGMLTLTSLIINALGGRPSIRSEAAAIGSHAAVSAVPARELLAAVVKFTVVFEAVGAILLYLTWGPTLGWWAAIWPSVFHAVSAFCNAGFSTNADSLMQFQQSPATIAVISFLIIAGGLGFLTIDELVRRARNKQRRPRGLSTHTRLVLVTTVVLLVGGCAMFALLEWKGALGNLPIADRLTNALFMSVTARTAGFNTVDHAALTNSSNFLTILLMMIGGSPGSTAGGVKTTTFAILGLLAWSRLRASHSVTFWKRSIPEETVQRAVGLIVVVVAIMVAGLFLVAGFSDLVDNEEIFLAEMFEVVSAFNTVGLSMGMTSHLTTHSRWVVILLMFIGRTGPLSLAAVLRARFAERGEFRYAHEDVIVG